MPVEEQTIADWQGTGYMVLDMENYTGSYMISGGLNGGTVGVDVGIAMLVNLLMTSIDIVETAHLYPLVLDAVAAGGLWGGLLGLGLLLLTTIIYIWIIEECERNFNLWYEYLDGNEAAGDALIENACLNVVITAGISAGVRVGGSLADNFIRKQAVKTINKIAGEEIAENLIENASKPGALVNAIKSMQKNGVTQEVIKKVVTTLPEDSILKIGKLTKKGLPQEFIEKLIDNKNVLGKYSDEILLLFKGSSKSFDDIVRLLDTYGNEFIENYRLYQDEAVDAYVKYADNANVMLDDAKLTPQVKQHLEDIVDVSGNVNVTKMNEIRLEIQKGNFTADEIKQISKKMSELGITQPFETAMKEINFGQYLRTIAGEPPVDMIDPHAHHILFKTGNGEAQQALVEEGQEILRKYGIDPIIGEENLVWAPNRITGQHNISALQEVVDALRAVDDAGGDYDDIVEVLRELGDIASQRN